MNDPLNINMNESSKTESAPNDDLKGDPAGSADARRVRSPHRALFATLVIGIATAQVLGMTLRTPTLLEANDISRWCTVWSLLERKSYVIDDCPWQARTQDKVFDVKGSKPRTDKTVKTDDAQSQKHFYSTKPPLLPTLIAGILYPFRSALGVPLDHETLQKRLTRKTLKDPNRPPSPDNLVVETPEAVHWPVFVFYLKPIVVFWNVVPYLLFLIYFARLLDERAEGDASYMLALAAAAWGTQLFIFNETLNNHSIGAYSAFFSLYAYLRIQAGSKRPIHFVIAGFMGAFCACNELPAALFGVILFLLVLSRDFKRTLIWFAPAAAIPCAAFLATQYASAGTLVPRYAKFGTEAYEFEGSYWQTPLEMDELHERKPMYLFHMILGHHGILSLTPIFLFSILGAFRALFRRDLGLRAFSAMTIVLTLVLIAFYTRMSNNYGGSTQGLRWLFWLYPFWLALLPAGLGVIERNRFVRSLALVCLFFSVFATCYGVRTPWSHPWVLDALEHLGLYDLVR